MIRQLVSSMCEAFVTLEQRPDLATQVRGLTLEAWAEFLQHDAVCNRYWRSLYSTFARFQVLLCDPADTVIAVGHTMPLVWDGTQADLPSGIDGVLERGVRDAEHSRTPMTLSALAAMVAPNHQRQGLSAAILQAMRSTAAANGLTALIAPVRPTLKHRYPSSAICAGRSLTAPPSIHGCVCTGALGPNFSRWRHNRWSSRARSGNGKLGPACAFRRVARMWCQRHCSRLLLTWRVTVDVTKTPTSGCAMPLDSEMFRQVVLSSRRDLFVPL